MRLRGFYVGRPQRVAALLLFILFAECLVSIATHPLQPDDYRYARCGREMWESPSVLQGYFTTCGNLNGDGTLAYRLAGLPLTLQRLTLLAADHLRSPANRLYPGNTLNGTTWESRHQLSAVKYLLRLPFVLFALWLGAGLWWVSKRLFGPAGGAFALGLYIFCPAILDHATQPNNDILAAWGLYGLIYTCIGVAHALQGPRQKWRPRLLLLTLALGLTAAAHLLAALLGLLAGTLLLLYLAERRRSHVVQIMIFCSLAATLIVFASFGLRLSAFSYVFTGGSCRFWFSTHSLDRFAHSFSEAGILVATAVALVFYLTHRPTRYFGNTAPLILALVTALLYTTQITSAPWLWALPFLFTFLGGVFADAFQSPQRKLYLLLAAALLLTQAATCWLSLAHILA